MSTNKLSAINVCLRGVGLAPVSAINDTDLDAATAESTIDAISTAVQSRGWWFNKEGNWKLAPDPNSGIVSKPSAAISVISSGGSRNLALSIRGNKIYDLDNHTYDLRGLEDSTGFITFTFIMELSFDELPEIARTAITYAARQQFAQDMEVDQYRYKFQSIDATNAMDAMIREDTRNTKRNSLTDNPAIASFLFNAGGVNSNLVGGF